MYYVKVQGESIEDLKEGLEKHLKELGGLRNVTHKAAVRSNLPTTIEDSFLSDDDMETIESPYSQPPTLVVDNEVDAEGLPWDARIHASSKAKVKDGTWRLQRGVQDPTINQVKNELRARIMNAPVMTTPPAYQQPPIQQAPVVHTPQVVTPPPAPGIPVMNNSGHTLETFKTNFAMIVGSLITQGKIDQDYVNNLKAYFQIQEIWMANDEQKAMVFDQFVQYNFIQRVG